MFEDEDHRFYMDQALEIAESCRDIEWYGVGCVIVSPSKEILATGYTGELKERDGKLRHAEDVAIAKAQSRGKDLKGAILYSTMEPCSVRASGKTPCVSHILEAGIGAVVYGAREPFDPALNIVCEGRGKLAERGVRVIHFEESEERCLKSVVSKRIEKSSV